MAEVKMNDPIADQLRQQYPSNSISHRLKPEEPEREKITPVVSGATLQKDSFFTKIKKIFLPKDIRDAKNYILKQVIVPGIQGGIIAMFEVLFYGQATRRPPIGGYSTQRTNYNYISSQVSRSPIPTQAERNSHNFQWALFQSYEDAENVVSSMLDILDRYGSVTVAEYYELCGVRAEYPDEDWGWIKFRRLEPRKVREGYVVDMEPPVLLNRR